MAIVPITKIRIFTYRHDVAKMLEIAQKIGAIEFKKNEEIEGFLSETNTSTNESNSTLADVTQAITFLSNYEEKLGTFARLKQGISIAIDETTLNNEVFDNQNLNETLSEIEEKQSSLTNLKDKTRRLSEMREVFLPWISLNLPLKSLTTTRTKTHLVYFKKGTKKIDHLTLLTNSLNEAGLESFVEVVGVDRAYITILNSSDNELIVLSKIKEFGGELFSMPATAKETVNEEISYIDTEVSALELDINKLEKEIVILSQKYLKPLKLTYDVYVWKRDRENALVIGSSTKRVTVFEGWINEKKILDFKENLQRNNLLCEVMEIPMQEKEIPPVEIENNALFRPFEIVTRLNGLPSHKDIDPTPFMAVFFFIFFGLCLTDVGYGALLMLATLPFTFYFKVSKMAKQFSQLIFLMGLSTVVIGMFFGGYFGISMSEMPKFLQDLQAFDPIGNPLPVFYLALSLGVVQIMTGMVLKIFSEAKNGQLANGLLDQGPWLLLFTLLIVYGANAFGYLAIAEERIMILIYLAIAFVILASGRTGKTILGKIQMSLLSVYNSINYLSDILSYSRLLALGLATSALAFAVNLIAGIVYEMIPYVGAILAVLVLIVGHLFTLVINTLGSFIHSARLQFVEFFGKFITGTGREFKPLTRKESYVSLLKEDSG